MKGDPLAVLLTLWSTAFLLPVALPVVSDLPMAEKMLSALCMLLHIVSPKIDRAEHGLGGTLRAGQNLASYIMAGQRLHFRIVRTI